MEFTIDEIKAVVKMNKPKISTCLFIWKHVLTGCFNYLFTTLKFSVPLKAQALQHYSKRWKYILLWWTVFWANTPPILWDLYLDLQNTNYWIVCPYLHCTNVWTTKNKGRGASLSFETSCLNCEKKLLLQSKLNSCFRHQRVYEKSMQERGNLRKP